MDVWSSARVDPRTCVILALYHRIVLIFYGKFSRHVAFVCVMLFGVPQRSFLGPPLFYLYITGSIRIFRGQFQLILHFFYWYVAFLCMRIA
jgi:hypothetical protein